MTTRLYPRILITGSIQCGKSTLVHSILTDLESNISGYFSKKQTNFKQGLEQIWLYDYCSALKVCFATKIKTGKFSVRLDQFDFFLSQILSSNNLTTSQIICIDEIGFLEKDSKILQDFIGSFQNYKKPVLLVVQKRILPEFQSYFQTPPWKSYDLDIVDSNSTKKEIITLLKF